MVHRTRRPCIAALLAWAALLSGAGAATARGQEIMIDGVLHVRNPATPPGGTRTLQLEEIWRAGGEDDDLLFGLLTQVRPDAAGNFYVLDSQLCQVHVFSPGGEHLRTLFREGEGPGEIREPRDVVLLPDGRVAVVVDFPGKLVTVQPDGTPAGTIMINNEQNEKGLTSLNAAFVRGGHLILTGTHSKRVQNPAIRERTHFVSSYDLQGRERVNHHSQLSIYDFENFVFAENEHLSPTWWNTEVGADGRVFLAPDNARYAIEVHAPDGTLERVIEREYEVYRRTQPEYDTFYAQVEGAMAGTGLPVTIRINDFAPCVHYIHRGLRIRDDGNLWILSSRGVRQQPPGVLCTFDIFAPDGRFREQVALACPGDATRDGVFFNEKGLVMVVRGFVDAVAAQFGRAREQGEDEQDAAMELVCYRIGGER